jgi:excisionase family DNA binding protein
MSALSDALLAEIGDDLIIGLADALVAHVSIACTPSDSPWLDAEEAAGYLRIGKSSLYRLQRHGVVPAYQDGPAARLFFHRNELDDYRRSNRA